MQICIFPLIVTISLIPFQEGWVFFFNSELYMISLFCWLKKSDHIVPRRIILVPAARAECWEWHWPSIRSSCGATTCLVFVTFGRVGGMSAYEELEVNGRTRLGSSLRNFSVKSCVTLWSADHVLRTWRHLHTDGLTIRSGRRPKNGPQIRARSI